jgi:hypothetical protein
MTERDEGDLLVLLRLLQKSEPHPMHLYKIENSVILCYTTWVPNRSISYNEQDFYPNPFQLSVAPSLYFFPIKVPIYTRDDVPKWLSSNVYFIAGEIRVVIL